jgi:hypothetical protein
MQTVSYTGYRFSPEIDSGCGEPSTMKARFSNC